MPKNFGNNSLPIFLMIIIFACKQKNKDTDPIKLDFTLPIVVQVPSKHTIEFGSFNNVNEVLFRFHGKYKFTDTLFFDEDFESYPYLTKGFYKRQWDSTPVSKDSTEGFQIITDYNTSIYYWNEFFSRGEYFFPVYVVNETNQTKVFTGKDSYAFGLQEAVDNSHFNNWYPIEYRSLDPCARGYFGLKVYPGEFVMILVPKYSGQSKTAMRVRLKIGELIYLSQDYVGIFNPTQFDIENESWIEDALKENKSLELDYSFYGSIPKGFN